MSTTQIWDSAEIERFADRLRRAETPFPSLAEDGWLMQSCVAPQLSPLGRLQFERTAALKSQPGQGFDFFHDLVLRHQAPLQEVIRSYSQRSGWQSLTRTALKQRSARLAAEWTRRGVTAGKRIALLLALGPEYVVALATALRMGLVVCPLPPRGALLTTRRLAALGPDFVYTLSLYTPLLAGAKLPPEQVLLDEPPATASEAYYASFTYAPKDPVLALFSPVREPAEAVTDVSAETAFGGALRELLLTFALEPGDTMAAPGIYIEQYLPGLLVMAMLGSVTYVHWELPDHKREPRLVAGLQLQLLIATRAFRDLLLTLPAGTLGKVDCLLRDPAESIDLGVWHRLIITHGLTKTAIGNLIYDCASGGTLLFSARRRGQVSGELLPAAGRGFALQIPEVTPRPALAQQGAFIPAGDKQATIVVARSEDQYLFGCVLGPRRDGRLYPELTAQAALATLPFIDGSAFALVPIGDGSGRSLLVLIVVTGSEPRAHFATELPTRIEAIRQRLRIQLGESFLPDHCELFPLLASRKKAVVDVDKLRSDYLTGALYQKTRDSRITLLHRLLYTCRNTALDRMHAGPPGPPAVAEVPC